jgi:flagellar biosynthesis chaperone FliJ
MNNPLVHAFFVGRALSEALYEQAEKSFRDTLSEVSKLDAELREQLHQFSSDVLARAAQAEEVAMQGRSGATAASPFASAAGEAVDLQALIDELRAEVAQLRSELKRYRSNQPS